MYLAICVWQYKLRFLSMGHHSDLSDIMYLLGWQETIVCVMITEGYSLVYAT